MTRPTTGELAEFSAPVVVDAAVTDLIVQRPGQIWKAADLVDGCGYPLLDTLMSLNRLARSGHIERTAPGRYRAASSGNNPPGA